METTTHKGRKELLFTGLPELLTTREIFALASRWIEQELVPHGIICEINVYRDHTVEIWCTMREILEENFGEILPVWQDVTFTTHLCQTFGEMINAALARQKESA